MSKKHCLYGDHNVYHSHPTMECITQRTQMPLQLRAKTKTKSTVEWKSKIICRYITYYQLQIGWTFHSYRSDSLETGVDNFSFLSCLWMKRNPRASKHSFVSCLAAFFVWNWSCFELCIVHSELKPPKLSSATTNQDWNYSADTKIAKKLESIHVA